MKNTILWIIICAILILTAVTAAMCLKLLSRKKVRLDPCVESAIRFFRGAIKIQDKSSSARLWMDTSVTDGMIVCRFADPEGGKIASIARRIHTYGDESGADNKHIGEAVNLSEFPDGTRILFDDEYTGYTLIFAEKLACPRLTRMYNEVLIRALAEEGVFAHILSGAVEVSLNVIEEK